jgi:hypothetical protein
MVPEHESQEQSGAGSESPPRQDKALSSNPEAPQATDSAAIPSLSGLPHETPVPLTLTGPESLPVRGWDVLLIAVMFVASDFLTTAAAALYAFRVYHESPEQLQSNTLVIVAAQIVAYAITFAVMYFLVTRRHRQRFWSGIRWRWPMQGRRALGLVGAGVLLALAISYLETVLPMPSQVPFEKLFTNADAAYVMGVLAILAAPLMEELFFRGFLYPVLRRSGAVIAIVVTSVAFALVHGGQYGWAWSVVLLMFLVGLVLTLVRARTGSVASGFLIHAGYNLTLFALLFISTDHFRHLERMGR